MLERVLKLLTRLPHRGSASVNEREAAAKLEELLRERGFAVRRQAFAAPRSYGPELLVISLLLAGGGLLVNAWLALLGMAAFWTYFSGWPRPWAALSDRGRSQNLLSSVGDGPRELVLMAHYDTAKSFFLYHPKRVRQFRSNFLLNATFAAATPLAALLWSPAGRLLGLYFLVQAALLAWREATAPLVQGANDNASGVAVAVALFDELAPRVPSGWRLTLALTGSEEVRSRGAAALLREIPAGAAILNIDNVGRGELCYAIGEGMLGFYRYRGPLVEAARRHAQAQPPATPTMKPLAYRLAFFDTLPFARAGYPCLTLIRLERGVPPHWHWPSDRLENLDLQAIDETKLAAHALVTSLWQEGDRT